VDRVQSYTSVLPNLIIIGAAKAGTTSLHHYLSLHPDVFMTSRKELRYFSHEDRWRRGRSWYEAQFGHGSKVRGESSPSYTQYPRFKEPPERMHALVPDARLIYLVRDPVERLVSHYAFSSAGGWELGTFENAIRGAESRFLWSSLYHAQVQRYLPYYDRSRIHVVALEDLTRNLRPTLQEVFRFLGVDDGFWSADFTVKLNEGRLRRANDPIRRRLDRFDQTDVAQRIPIRWRTAARKYLFWPFSKPVSRPALTDPLRKELEGRLREDAAAFREWTGRAFEDWSV